MTTVATMVERIRREIYGGHRPQLNVLAADLVTAGVSATMVQALDAITTTQILSIDNEILYVSSAPDRNGRTVPLMRGMFGTDREQHLAGAIVEVGARWYKASISEILLEEIQSWPSSIYRIGAVNLAATSGTRGYDLNGVPSDFYDILEVVRAPAASTVGTNQSWPRINYRVERQLDPAAFPSGAGLFLERCYDPGTALRVIYNRPFNLAAWTDAVDLQNDVGLSNQLLDVLKYGTMWRLASTGETARTDPRADHDVRDDQAVPAGLNTNNARALKALRDQRISDEAVRLIDIWKLAGV